MTAQEAFFNDLNATNPTGMAEFNAVCGSHEDYVWVRTPDVGGVQPGLWSPYGLSLGDPGERSLTLMGALATREVSPGRCCFVG